ncbi:nuclease-related domain-containing protein [Tuberibacillus sp. Marseille-P3662]|uniref:nuclease-related domain-containing protein n=1 Tax=Tuberibacillus sp. Marseille-P3662 TaxID=1965358 RepID=UPI000A1CEE07|nr:nuclease-related domain-containing protein [Tuberibacillus sp. Marseille-P3662]
MAQLIKLDRYVSRYEDNLFHYASQYIKIKQGKWAAFKNQSDLKLSNKMRHTFHKTMFRHQLVWASSTLNQRSEIMDIYKHHQELQFLLSNFSDTVLLMFHPIIQNGQLNTIMIHPGMVWNVKLLLGETDSVFQGDTNGTWQEITSNGRRSMDSPLHSIHQSATSLKKLLAGEQQQMPVHHYVLAPNSFIENYYPTGNVDIVDKRQFLDLQRKGLDSGQPMRHQQLNLAKWLLEKTETTAISR